MRPAAIAQIHVQNDAPHGSDASTHPDIAADSDVPARVDGDAMFLMENADGEIRTSRLAGTPKARLAKDANGETPISRSDSGATHPVDATAPTPTSAHPVQGKRSPSETFELFRQILLAPSSPTTSITNHGTPIGNQAFRSSPEATQAMLPGAPPSLGAQPVSRGPMAPLRRPVMPKVYGLPAERAQNYSLIHILVDSIPATTGNGPVPRQDSNIAFAVPSSKIPQLLTVASRHIAELKDLMKQHPVASSIVDEHKLTCEPFIDTSTSNPLRKRKRNEEAETLKTIATDEAAAKSVGRAMRHAFAKMADERRRVALEESRVHARSPETEVLEEQLIDTRKTSDNPYNYDEVAEPDEGRVQVLVTNSQDQVQEEQVPETPPARGWGLSSFLPSVSRFIPFSSRRTPSAAAAPPLMPPDAQAPAESLTTKGPRPGSLAACQQPLETQQATQTEPRQRSDASRTQHDDPGRATSSAFAQRVHREKSQRILLTKKQAEERRKLKQEKEQLRADKERLIREEARIAQEKKEWEEERARATGAHIPGTKRKRVPSPESYPLPARGFGLVDAIFDYSSDEESSEEEQDTPTRPRPNKKARLSSSSMEINGDPVAPQYEGASFVGAGASSEGVYGNIFGRRATINTEANTTTPSGPSMNRFAVPSPTDSDPDEEAVEGGIANTITLPSQQDQSSQVATTSRPKSMPPPPTPNTSHASLPSVPTWAPLDPVEKAREKALKHQPKYGSRLRESSRLSSSTVGSDAGAQPLEDNTEIDESQYDPRSPAMLPNTFPSPRSSAVLPNSFPASQAKSVFAGYQAKSAQDTTTVRHGHAPWDGLAFSYDSYRKTMTPGVEAHIEVTWDEDGDDVLIGLGDRQFDADFEAWKLEQNWEEAMGDGTRASSTANESEQLSYEKADISAKVRALINDNVTKEDEEKAINDFDEEYEAWRAKEMQKQGALMPSIIA